MIRLRTDAERALRHPLFGPLVLLVVVVLLAFVAIHSVHDAVCAGAALMCVYAIAFAAARLARAVMPALHVLPLGDARGPPRAGIVARSRARSLPISLPLRL